MQERWREYLTPKIHSLYDTEFKQAQATLDWQAVSNDIRVYCDDSGEVPLKEAFINRIHAWITTSKLNSFKGLESYPTAEVIFGCTQFIEDFHIICAGKRLRYSHLDYPYYWSISSQKPLFLNEAPLKEGDALIISCPFTFEGDLYPNFQNLLDECLRLDIPVFVDSAWVGTCRDISFDFSHAAISAIGFSLSKGLGLGDQRIGIRFRRKDWGGSVAVLNQFDYLPYIQMHLGIHMMNRFSVDHLQLKYGDLQEQICKKFALKPTKCIHLAHALGRDWDAFDRTQSSRPLVGTAHLLRAIYEDRWR